MNFSSKSDEFVKTAFSRKHAKDAEKQTFNIDQFTLRLDAGF